MNVYLVGTGEFGEGIWPEAIFSSLPVARKYVEDTYHVHPLRVLANVWRVHRNSTDLVEIYRFRLDEAAS